MKRIKRKEIKNDEKEKRLIRARDRKERERSNDDGLIAIETREGGLKGKSLSQSKQV